MDYDYDELFPGRFLKAGEFQGRNVTLRIVRVEIDELPDKKGTKKNKDGVLVKVKPILFFEKKQKNGSYVPLDKGIILNKTNGECVKAMFGRKTKEWIGKRVTFYPAVVEAFGEQTEAIRVRGSPDIEADIRAELKLGQKTRSVTLKRTDTLAASSSNGHQRPAAAAKGEDPPGSLSGADDEPPGDLPDEPPLFDDEPEAQQTT